jgi:2-amino-4-hydroxy-6-hydroxymethyldihydropteridine diphosphokinase
MILIGIGANLIGPHGNSLLDTVRWAAFQLDGLLNLHLRSLSRWYRTEPLPASEQPFYVNGVAHLAVPADATEPEPAELLLQLQAIEARAGRVRGERNAARTLDLDIIAMGEDGQTTRVAPDPILPHPRAHLRAFVLMPLLEVAPNWLHPSSGLSAQELLARLPRQAIEPIEPDDG